MTVVSIRESPRRKALRERDEAARELARTRDLSAYIDRLSGRCAHELESNNFGEAIRHAMRRRPA